VLLIRGLHSRSDKQEDCLDRLGLAAPKSLSDRLYAALVRGALTS
jgi:hypothetical protein